MGKQWCCNCQKTNHDCWECHSSTTVYKCCARMAMHDALTLPEKRISPAENPHSLNPFAGIIRNRRDESHNMDFGSEGL